ncbi:MAG: aspartyl-tRNA amidotransferase [Candidatus Kerfeldbacteria bacterium CG15_BIG_FIL_POST_REV_8_21_14_020_45_12]|uniref:Aspartyl-tRNA amidotransferase n=1 Tax=Candidatus Kerfeldbacteria bacterium CG15_BIG_FIL_POST_REV_8_21_14_020_45_12 TaxID=2014247 RepID=A0A2M7H1Z6_9BACT|nr:MAG: aspartyl-tRNA amidotransferase [Candidatus Kerfeldbacteria bacterium CG15_BIG_FIL_POST_REV_8_21_14_020_45_12]PJA93440.1 MAG: aspartyl-tRNA amidotransferase [Candidatus Kerfeldbacteria bacterium CG_4_9_14_3_um_filter_45_8]
MSLYETILADLTTAMKEQNAEKREVLRLIKSALKNEAIAQGTDQLDDEGSTAVLIKEGKKRRDSIEQFAAGGRQDLADKEQAELAIIQTYLPAQISEEDIRTAVQAVISETGSNQFGAVMGQAMQRLKGQADGDVVKKIVQEFITG